MLNFKDYRIEEMVKFEKELSYNNLKNQLSFKDLPDSCASPRSLKPFGGFLI